MTTMEKLIKIETLANEPLTNVVRSVNATAEYYVEKHGTNINKIRHELVFDKKDFDDENIGDLYAQLVLQTCEEILEEN